ncbi:MAG: carboxylic ester hydrolase [Candidatus Hydrogenedentota bacterium]
MSPLTQNEPIGAESGRGKKERPWLRRIVVAFVGLTAVSVAVSLWLLYSRHLPVATGPYAVGRADYYWVDESRAEILTAEPDDNRPLIVQIWYPSDDVTGCAAAPYFPHLRELSGSFHAYEVLGIAPMKTHSYLDAPVSVKESEFPVLLFSPGANSFIGLYTSILEELVSHGYVVVAMDHAYDNRGQVLPDGKVLESVFDKEHPRFDDPAGMEAMNAYYRKFVGIRAADAQSILRRLEALNQSDVRFMGRLDLDRVGVLGHSLGGVAAAEAAKLEPRFKAAANLDGHFMDRPKFDDGDPLRAVFLHMGDPFPPMPEQGSDTSMSRFEQSMNSIQAASYSVWITGANHQNFSDDPLLKPGNTARELEINAAVRAYLVAFFDYALKGKPTPLLAAGPSADHGYISVSVYPSE